MSGITPGSGIPSDVPPAVAAFLSEIGKFTIPLFVGTVINWALLGSLAVQVYIYYLAFPKDRLSSKSLVAFVVVVEIIQTLGCSRDAIRVFGAEWGNPQVFSNIGWQWFSVPILSSLIAVVGQMFFAWRIYIIARTLYVPTIIALVTAVQLGASIWTAVDMYRTRNFPETRLFKPPEVWLAATASADLMIVAGMVFYLLKAREPEFTRRIKATLSRIIKVTVETGVLCAVAALVVLALFVAYDGNNYHLGVCIWLSKVYSNSMLIILNSRAYIGHDPTPPGSTTKIIEMGEIVFNNSVGPTSTMQSFMQERSTAADDGLNVGALESKRGVIKQYLEVVVQHSSVGIQEEMSM
ncbi:hypothetical protein MSAN_01727400 [Mycena sanguinolenta]|uniref:DUF6534 domain-containing protein n=1 Tax=Mycena sanguinolenta TaxID=230812 RepID=A0A8H7CVC6_9AGAR|nr:hypothetical protein MSAN_01727400 [Mycena sanguinolenta]